jgi:hypothetical protein
VCCDAYRAQWSGWEWKWLTLPWGPGKDSQQRWYFICVLKDVLKFSMQIGRRRQNPFPSEVEMGTMIHRNEIRCYDQMNCLWWLSIERGMTRIETKSVRTSNKEEKERIYLSGLDYASCTSCYVFIKNKRCI